MLKHRLLNETILGVHDANILNLELTCKEFFNVTHLRATASEQKCRGEL